MLEIYFLEIEKHWSWHAMLLELIMHLQKNYDVKMFHKDGKDGKLLYCERFDVTLSDCEILIYDTEKDILKGILFCEQRADLYHVFAKRNNPNDIMLLTHPYGIFSPSNMPQHNFKIAGTVYYPWKPYIDYNYYYTVRKFRGYNNLIDKMFCLFTTNKHDPHTLRDIGLVSQSPGPLSIMDYLDLAIEHKVGLSVHGVAEVCHRDFEYMAIGLPMIRLEYINNTLQPPLIPNYHYISIDRGNFPIDGRADREGGPEYVEAYKKRFLEVKDDYEFLQFISENAKKYIDDNCGPNNRTNHMLNLLNIK